MRVNGSSPIERMLSNFSKLPAQVALLAFGFLIATTQSALGSVGSRRGPSENHLENFITQNHHNSKTSQQLDSEPIAQQLLQINHNLLPQHVEVTQVSAHGSDSTSSSPNDNTNTNDNKVLKNGQLPTLRNRCILAERELDRCSARLIGLGQSGGLTYPDSMQKLDSVYCPKFRETVACIRNNTDCYKPFERQIINWILSSTKKMNYKRCKSENEKIRFLRLTSSCFALMRNPMDDCMSRYIGQLDAVAEFGRESERLTESDRQIQLACCANNRFKRCIMRGARQGCQPAHDNLKKLRRANSLSSQRAARRQLEHQLQDTMEDLKWTLDQMALTGPEFICNGVDEKFCRLHFDGRYSNRLAQHRSIVPAMIKIYANK